MVLPGIGASLKSTATPTRPSAQRRRRERDDAGVSLVARRRGFAARNSRGARRPEMDTPEGKAAKRYVFVPRAGDGNRAGGEWAQQDCAPTSEPRAGTGEDNSLNNSLPSHRPRRAEGRVCAGRSGGVSDGRVRPKQGRLTARGAARAPGRASEIFSRTCL
jgi:hypothetical protein